MDAVSARRERDIHAVVDQHASAMRTRHSHGGACKFSELPRGEVSFADLNKLTAQLRRRADDGELLAPLISFRRLSCWAERSAVGYQVE